MKEMVISFGRMLRYDSFIIVGVAMVATTLIKLLGIATFSSDWFWFLAGVGLIIEGIIAFIKQKQFDKKYKVIEIGSPEYKKLYKK